MSLPRVVVVGGAGAFGSRLAEGLAATTDCEVVIAGRSIDRAERTKMELLRRHPAATVKTARIDAAAALPHDLGSRPPALVIDAAGPYLGGTYSLARACIEASVPYVDLADGRAHVAGFASALDARARATGTPAICGASSTPALSNAAIDDMTRGWQSLDTVDISISPGNRAPRGLSVFESILSYVGKPVRVLRDGSWGMAPGWGLTEVRQMEGLGLRRLSLCQTPDLDVVPERHPDVRTVVFRAGLELRILHDGLRLAALPVRAGILPSLLPLARAFRRMAIWFEPFGTDRGGMEVAVEGTDAEGNPARSVWHLVAEAGDGPYVPTLPALALARKILGGDVPSPGARACAGILSLHEIEAEMSRHAIRTGVTLHSPEWVHQRPAVFAA